MCPTNNVNTLLHFGCAAVQAGCLVRPMADFGSKSATGNAPSADAGNERETYDAR